MGRITSNRHRSERGCPVQHQRSSRPDVNDVRTVVPHRHVDPQRFSAQDRRGAADVGDLHRQHGKRTGGQHHAAGKLGIAAAAAQENLRGVAAGVKRSIDVGGIKYQGVGPRQQGGAAVQSRIEKIAAVIEAEAGGGGIQGNTARRVVDHAGIESHAGLPRNHAGRAEGTAVGNMIDMQGQLIDTAGDLEEGGIPPGVGGDQVGHPPVTAGGQLRRLEQQVIAGFRGKIDLGTAHRIILGIKRLHHHRNTLTADRGDRIEGGGGTAQID